MKHTILLIIFLFLNISCNNKSDKQNKIMIQESNVPLEKQITYSIELNIKLPYELYINDIKADYDYIGANSSVEINPYLLKNGISKIRIKIFPAFKANKKLIALDDLKNSTISFGHYIMDKSKKDLHSYNTDDFKLLNYNLPIQPVPYFEQEWEVEIKDLPYELEGWSKGQDLSKMDQKELEKRVTGYYKNLWTILNDGNFDKWKILTNKRFNEYSVYSYLSLKNIEESINNNEKDIREYAKSTMIPLENFEMKIYAYGKIVALEKSIHTHEFNNQKPLDIYSWSPLISKGKISGAADYPVLLYLQQNSDEFVIIRK